MGNFCEYHGRNGPGDSDCQPRQLAGHKFGDVSLHLDEGDIKNEDVDVIVLQTDVTLRLPPQVDGVSPNIKAQLTRDIQKLQGQSNYTHGEVVQSHAAELDFDFVFYCVLPSENDTPAKLSKKTSNKHPNLSKSHTQKYQKQFIYDCTIKCLKLAEQLELPSICFSAMSSINFTIATVAAMQMLALKNHLEENIMKLKHLNCIRFCLGEPKEIEPFTWAFNKVFLYNLDSSEASDEESINSNKEVKYYEYELHEKKRKPKFKEDDFIDSFGANYYSSNSQERKLSI